MDNPRDSGEGDTTSLRLLCSVIGERCPRVCPIFRAVAAPSCYAGETGEGEASSYLAFLLASLGVSSSKGGRSDASESSLALWKSPLTPRGGVLQVAGRRA